jgi:predicted amidophosphoribosyltransferase
VLVALRSRLQWSAVPVKINPRKRAAILKDAFAVDTSKTEGRRLLLVDDLYRSGATVSAIAQLLTSHGATRAVYLLTLTQTRKLV